MKAALIIPYFGKFNSYFSLFLNSCSNSELVDFLIFTDDKAHYDYPSNFKVVYTTFEEMNQRIIDKVGLSQHLQRPYKLCDYRPIYGFLFEEYLADYAYWGYCDTDLIFGDLDRFLAPIFREKYEKIFCFGHCTLIKNTAENNRLLLTDDVMVSKLKDIDNNYSLDEEFNGSINNLFMQCQKSMYTKELQANTYTKTSNFYLTKWNNSLQKYEIIKRKNHVFVREEKGLFEYFIENGQLIKKEYLYMHFQSRPMELKVDCNSSVYKIIPNAFEPLEYTEVSLDNFAKIKKKNWNLHYFRLRSKNLKIKLERKLKKKWK